MQKPAIRTERTPRVTHTHSHVILPRMFCSTNEVLLSLTEKTKLLAQKCTQFRSNGGGGNGGRDGGVTTERIKAISKSINDVRDDKQLDEILKSVSMTRKWPSPNDKATATPTATTCFSSLAGSLRLKRQRRKSLTDTIQNDCCARRKAHAATISGRTTRWYVKVSI